MFLKTKNFNLDGFMELDPKAFYAWYVFLTLCDSLEVVPTIAEIGERSILVNVSSWSIELVGNVVRQFTDSPVTKLMGGIDESGQIKSIIYVTQKDTAFLKIQVRE